VKGDLAVVDGELLDEPERDDVAAEIGVLDGPQCLQNLFTRRHDHLQCCRQAYTSAHLIS
jgi:hypothetical protein